MEPKRTHLYQYHADYGNIVNFHGFEMPLWYDNITSEHMAVRNAVGLFDVTHMGRTVASGERSAEFLDYILTRDPSKLAILQGHYSNMCNPLGGIIDDLTVYNLGDDKFLIIYNAGNRIKDYQCFVSQVDSFDANVVDVSDETALFALQGPKAQETLQQLTKTDLSKVRRYWIQWLELSGQKVLVARSGYTGEDGFEILVWDTPLKSPEKAIALWQRILDAGSKFGIKPCGLGARDTLRLEAGMCLYGNDIDEKTTPLEAKLDFVIKFEKPSFIGREALLRQKEEGIKKARIGLKMLDRAIPREGCKLLKDGEEIGYLTSGTYSPLMKYGIGMGYVPVNSSLENSILEVEIRDNLFKAEVVKMPFYDADKYGWRRKNL